MVSKRSLNLFKKAVKDVPAYKKFLQENNLDPSKVKSLGDFLSVPITSKKTYLQANERQDLLWEKDYWNCLSFCSTSGSTGEPYYFPRRKSLDIQASYMAEQFLKQSSYGYGGRTLVIMGFGMGVWIGGLITLRAFELAAERMKMPVSFLAPGYNKKEIFKALKKLAPEYDQVILAGYPPFIKELIDEADEEAIDFSKINLRLMFAAEAFTETFRKYVAKKARIKNQLRDTLNIYGTADIGAMAYETPLSILIRKLVLEDPLLYQDVFGQIEKTPTLAQYNPEYIEFEEINGEIILTGDNAVPLIRYAIGDNGGVFSCKHISQLFARYNIDIDKEASRAGIKDTVNKKMPFVFVYERTDLSASLHGILIYPEFIKEALLKPTMQQYFTERFTMATKTDIHHNQFLQINIELRKDVNESEKIKKQVQKTIMDTLKEKSSEFSEISKTQSGKKLLQIVLWRHGHPRYFAPGVKQKWVEK